MDIIDFLKSNRLKMSWINDVGSLVKEIWALGEGSAEMES